MINANIIRLPSARIRASRFSGTLSPAAVFGIKYHRPAAKRAIKSRKIDPKITGGFRWSVVQKTGVISKHAYGLAVDLNWEHNAAVYTPQWSYAPGKDPLSVTPEIAAIWKRHGFDWGGDFPEDSRDPMHFCFTLR